MNSEILPKFPVGTKFLPIQSMARNSVIHEVKDFLITRNLAGELIRKEYVVTHEFCGQTMRELVTETTVARGVENLKNKSA